MIAAQKLPDFLTVDEFLAWDAPPGALWQLVDGVPQAMAPPSPTHGVIQSRIDRLVGNFLDSQSSPCAIVITPGVIIPSNPDINFRIPDLGVTCSPIGQKDAALVDPILLIEILSPSNQAETWINVWAYTTIPTVREVVVFRTAAIGALVLRRGEDGAWPDQPTPVTEGELVLESIGFRVAINDLYRATWLAAGDSASR